MVDSFAVQLADATPPLVLSIDIGSTGTRGGIFDAAGRPVSKTRMRVEHTFRTDTTGRADISPDSVTRGVVAVIDGVTSSVGDAEIAGVALDTFAPSLVGVSDGAAITPCYTYADSRNEAEVEALRGVVTEGRLQQITGTHLHTSYWPARLRWLARTEPDTFDLVDSWMSIGEYVWWRILGERGAAVSTAAWSGLLGRESATWADRLLPIVGIQQSSLADIRMPDEPFTPSQRAGRRWRQLRGAVWFPAIPDGFASQAGTGQADDSTVILTAATSGAIRMILRGVPASVPAGLWCYRVDRERSMVGGALSDVGRVVTWLDGLLAMSAPGRIKALTGPPHPASPIALPFLTGERSVGWHGGARGLVSDLSPLTDSPAFYRGVMESVAMTYRQVAEQIAQIAPTMERIVASGGIATSLPQWLPIVSSVLGMPLLPVPMKRSTLRGNAVLAAEQLAPNVARAVPDLGGQIEPNPAWVEIYQERYRRYLELYETFLD